jgi:hypothetical protein
MVFRFELSHSSGSQVISEPDGWKEISMVLDRDPEYFGLIEQFEVPLRFYGSNGEHDGGKDFIENIEETYGVGAVITIKVDISPDGAAYDQLFEGTLDLSTLREIDGRKLEIAIIPKSFWAKFKNRFETPVDLQSTTNLDGDVVSPASSTLVKMTSQIIRYYGEYRWYESYAYFEPDGGAHLQLDWDKIAKDDIKKLTVPRGRTSSYTAGGLVYTNAVPQFEAPWDGDYHFDIKITAAVYNGTGTPEYQNGDLAFRIRRAGEYGGPANFTKTIVYYDEPNLRAILIFTFDGVLTLKKGEQVIIYGDDADDIQIFGEERLTWLDDCDLATTTAITLSGEQNIDGTMTSSSRVLVKNQGNPAENGVYISNAGAWTRATDNDSAAEMNMVAVYVIGGTQNLDSAWKQIQPITTLGVDLAEWQYTFWNFERFVPWPFPGTPVENYLKVTASTVYPETTSEGFFVKDAINGVIERITIAPLVETVFDESECEWNHVLIKGLQQRGFTLTEKPFFTSLKELWAGLNPIFNLGIGHEMEGNQDKIVIRPKSYFFDDTPSLVLSWVNNIERTHDRSMIFKKISIGYEKWQAEEISGLDDPQSKKIYATIFETVGTEITLYSRFIAASLAIEVTRRKSTELLTDYKFDNDIFIIAVNPEMTEDSPSYFSPELDENFVSITGLQNAETRYNLFLTPLRNFLRWANFFNGALQKNLSSVYKFVSGEGNYEMSSQYDCTSGLKEDCEGTLCADFAENDDIPILGTADQLGHIFSQVQYEFTHPLTWEDYKTIRDNRNKAILVSSTDANYEICFIKRLEYDINKSKGKFTVWKK